MEWEFGIRRCKLLSLEWINNKVLLYSTGNYIQYLLINNNGKEKKFYMYIKTEEAEIKLPTSAGSSKRQESSRKTSVSALLSMPKPLTVWITINSGKF